MAAARLKRRPDPRIERSRQVILEAALQELGEIGYGAFTIESVAARAGAGKSTIYRHWPDKLELIADAFQTFHEQRGPDIGTGSPRQRVERVLRHVAEVVVSSTFSTCIPALIDDFPAHADPELAALALLGAIFYRRLMTAEPFDPERASDLVDTVLGASRASRDG